MDFSLGAEQESFDEWVSRICSGEEVVGCASRTATSRTPRRPRSASGGRRRSPTTPSPSACSCRQHERRHDHGDFSTTSPADLHGQYGYRTELPLAQRLNDVLGLQIGDGTAQIIKLVIARQRVGRELAP
jgi:hypothetical protein